MRDIRCSVCNRDFENNSSRNIYKMRYGSKRVFEYLCTEPDYARRFDTKSHLESHINSVSLIPFKLLGCLRFYQVHVKANRFVCCLCGKVFYRSDYLV